MLASERLTKGGARDRVSPQEGASKPSSSTPPTDRGYLVTKPPPRQPFQVHWFTGTAHLDFQEVLEHVHSVSGFSFLPLRFGRQGYRSAYDAVELPGLTVLCDPGDPDNMPPVCVVVPGEACEALGWDSLQALTAPFCPTRVDLAFDDFPFAPAEVKAHILADRIRTRAQRHTLRWHEDYEKVKELGHPGETCSFGSRASSAFFRCYNSRGFNRGELELKGHRAQAAYELLQAPLEDARLLAISFMRAFLDFVDPSTSTNKSRQDTLLPWLFWYRHVQRVLVKLPPRPPQLLDKSWRWFLNQLSPTVAMLHSLFPAEFEEALLTGCYRWTLRQRLLVGGAALP